MPANKTEKEDVNKPGYDGSSIEDNNAKVHEETHANDD